MARLIRIENGQNEMRSMAKMGNQANYIPTLHGRPLEEEGGVTVISTENLRKVAKAYGKPLAVEMVETPDGEQQFLFYFVGNGYNQHQPNCYLATGYSIGYAGEGPTGLARILAEFSFGDFESLREDIVKGEWEAGIIALNGGVLVKLANDLTNVLTKTPHRAVCKNENVWPYSKLDSNKKKDDRR